MSLPVTVHLHHDVMVISLSRAESGNAIDLALAEGLLEAVSAAREAPGVGALVLQGDGKHFSVGGDLAEFAAAQAPGDHVIGLARTMHAAILTIRELPFPTISAVQGACAGGGLGLALAADLVVAEQTARFVTAYLAAGLSPDCGVSWTLSRAVGAARANELLLTNRPVDGEEAARMGLVTQVVETGAARDAALELARTLAAGPREANARTVGLTRSAHDARFAEHLDREATSIAAMAESPDGREGVVAFLHRRRPAFAPAPVSPA